MIKLKKSLRGQLIGAPELIEYTRNIHNVASVAWSSDQAPFISDIEAEGSILATDSCEKVSQCSAEGRGFSP
jgi:hypothetical protein